LLGGGQLLLDTPDDFLLCHWLLKGCSAREPLVLPNDLKGRASSFAFLFSFEPGSGTSCNSYGVCRSHKIPFDSRRYSHYLRAFIGYVTSDYDSDSDDRIGSIRLIHDLLESIVRHDREPIYVRLSNAITIR